MRKPKRGNSVRTPEAGAFGARTVWLWALWNSLVGLAVGGAIHLFAGSDITARGLVPMSVVFANVVGFAALLTLALRREQRGGQTDPEEDGR